MSLFDTVPELRAAPGLVRGLLSSVKPALSVLSSDCAAASVEYLMANPLSIIVDIHSKIANKISVLSFFLVIYNQARCTNDIDLLSWFYVSVAGVCEGNVKWMSLFYSITIKLLFDISVSSIGSSSLLLDKVRIYFFLP